MRYSDVFSFWRLLAYCFTPALPTFVVLLFFFNDPATTEIYTLSLHDALPISSSCCPFRYAISPARYGTPTPRRSEEHTSELQSRGHLVCRLLLEKKKRNEHVQTSNT